MVNQSEGAALAGDTARKIVGISVARKKPRGQEVVEKSVSDYLQYMGFGGACPEVIFEDSYICGGYGCYNNEIADAVRNMIINDGVPLNTTYTAKAFWGMLSYIETHNISHKNILFLNTGGSPLFFDDLGGFR